MSQSSSWHTYACYNGNSRVARRHSGAASEQAEGHRSVLSAMSCLPTSLHSICNSFVRRCCSSAFDMSRRSPNFTREISLANFEARKQLSACKYIQALVISLLYLILQTPCCTLLGSLSRDEAVYQGSSWSTTNCTCVSQYTLRYCAYTRHPASLCQCEAPLSTISWIRPCVAL